MTIKKNIFLVLCLLGLSSTTQPIGQLALDKALGTCYNTIKQAVSNNPWATVIGLGAASLIAATYYKPYTLIAWPMDNPQKFFEVDKFRTFSELKNTAYNYKMIGYATHCFYKNERFIISGDTVLPTLLQCAPSQQIADFKKQGWSCHNLSTSYLQNFFRRDLEQAADIATTLKKARVKTNYPNTNQEYAVFMLTPSQSNFVLLIRFATESEAQHYCQKLSKNNPQWGCKDLSTKEEKQAGYFFLYADK